MVEQTPQLPHAQNRPGAHPAAASVSVPSGQSRKSLEVGLDFLYRQRFIIIVCTAVVLAAAAAYAYTREPAYVASSLVRVNLEERARSSSGAQVSGIRSEDVFATNDRPLMAEVFLLQTSSMLRQRVAERLGEVQLEASRAGTQRPGGSVLFGVADLAANTIAITATSEDPQQAALLANLYADEYVRLTEEAVRSRLSAQRSSLEEREEQQREQLARIEDEQRARAASGSAFSPSQDAGFVALQISNLEGQRDQVQTELRTRRASLRAAEADLAALEPRLSERLASDDEQRLQDLQSRVAALRSEQASTERRYPDAAQRDPRVSERLRQLEADIQRLEAESERLSQRLVAAGGLSGGATGGASSLAYAAELRRRVQGDRAAIEALEEQSERIADRLTQQYAELRRLPQAAMLQASQQIAQAQVERERFYAAETYEEAASQLRDIQVAEATSAGYARLIQGARVPTEPSQIPASRYLLLGAFFGLTLGFGLAFGRDRVDNRIYKPEQLREWGYPVLATIPNLRPLLEEEFGGEEYIEVGGRRLSTSLVSLLNPMSPPAEAYRHLRTSVLSLPGTARPATVLIVTSPGAQDGKSTTASNLAVSFAQAGHRTLLLDADLRRPSVHKIFGIPRTPGLIQHLSGSGESGRPEVVTVGVDDLYVVPAGEVAAMGDGAAPRATPATALGSPATTGYLQWLREQFDFIVIDTPPLLATTDALQLARQSDGVIVAVRARQTREGELSHVLESLEQVGAPVIGTVLNGFDVSMAYGYKYRYRSYTEYGPYPDYGAAEGGEGRGRRKKRRQSAGAQDQPAPLPEV